MMRGLTTAAGGMEAEQLNLDVIANNLANVNTTGYKKVRVDFEDILYQEIKTAGTQEAQGITNPTGLEIGLGVRPGATQHINIQGDLQQTGNQLDLAIEGQGFFQFTQPDGTIAYGRDGSLKRDQTGRLVTSDGVPLSPEIDIPQNAVSVSVGQDGTVSAVVQGSAAAQVIGQINLATFVNPAGLQSQGNNLLTETTASGPPIIGIAGQNGIGTIQQGFLEGSNVQAVEELINIITAQRAFEMNSRVVTTADNMLNVADGMVH